MLRLRVATALVLVAVLFAALAAPGKWPFALVTLALLAAGAWEWGRLNAAGNPGALVMGVALAAAGIGALWAGWPSGDAAAAWWLLVLLWLAAGTWVLRSGQAAWLRLPRGWRLAGGFVLLFGAWAALIQIRAGGINFLLSTLCLVWMADIAAYFGGRALGRRKLAPSISPGKSWEGVWSGMAGVALLALFWTALDARYAFDGPSLYTRLAQAGGWVPTMLVLLALTALSVVGDLIESLAKRAAGAKDSSRLLPGHGGVLDRVDALLPVLPAALAVLALVATARGAAT